MKKTGQIIFVIVLSSLLVQCSFSAESGNGAQALEEVITLASTNKSHLLSTETEEIPNVNAPTLSIASPTVTNQVPTSTPELRPGISQECLNISPKPSKDNQRKGKIVFLENNKNNKHLLYDLETGKKKDIPNVENYLIVSPNQKMFAYEDAQSQKLMIFTSDGQLLRSMERKKDWGFLGKWQNNEQIIFPKYVDPPNEEYPHSLIVLNPFSGEEQILQPKYPNIENTSYRLEWEGSGTTVYDPMITEVVYPGYIEGKGMGYILFDIKDKTKLTELPSSVFGNTPKWFLDGSKFIVNARGGEFYLITRDGDIKQITHMNPAYDPSKNDFNYESYFYSLSPDERYLALWLTSSLTKDTTLAILNISTGEVTDFCIPHGPDPLVMPYMPIPIWSPDSKAIVVDANYQNGGNGNDVILIDLIEKNAIRIDQNLTPVGWLALP
ncbi:MAG: hypothetical protein GX434_06850 [Peptococcaceae bacterium]|nr:hypothetical protein [Peptococcaceae bacterium]